ncbi:MAG: flagellar protein FlgN [Clostridiales bacterium]|jgi:flagellar biosynthesis/type III secretory pathway chaperone|nr:flagellar protein FlgN [Clostridiales bacterium]
MQSFAAQSDGLHSFGAPAGEAPPSAGTGVGGAPQSAETSGVRYAPEFGAALVSAAAPAPVSAAPTRMSAPTPAPLRRPASADRIADRLADVLERETLLYRDASDISAKKTEVIVRGKIEELDSLVKAEQAIILKIGRLEGEREGIIGELSAELDLDLEGVTLSDINARLGEASFQRLDGCQKQLAATLGGLKDTNDMNAQLIQNALDYINFSVNLITSDQSGGNVYSPDGEEGGGKTAAARKHIFDVKL